MTRAFSIEDGNLQSTILGTRKKDYSDIDLSFTLNTINDVYKKLDAEAVRQSVKNIVLTSYHEKPFRPNFGTGVRELLFELLDQPLVNEIDFKIRQAIQKWEPRAKVEDLKVQGLPDDNALIVTLVFSIRNSNKMVTLETTITRLR